MAVRTTPADLSMRWARPVRGSGRSNSSFWNPPPSTQPDNTNYYTYVEQATAKLGAESRLFSVGVDGTGTISITDHRANPTEAVFGYDFAAAIYLQLQRFAERQLM